MSQLRFLFTFIALSIAATTWAAPSFVGTEACGACHAKALESWKGSDHDLAMQHATPATVLGDFRDRTYMKSGITTTFSRRGERFVIRTDGPDGKLADFEVKYVFGVKPLQQYLLALPGGRLQAFTLAWDSRPRERGGQRWFDLYPKEKLVAGDELHWTGRQQNWNFMCADCHSTGLVKGYDATKNAFDTHWSAINVGCEACHGPGSAHVAWAKAGAKGEDKGLTANLDERRGVTWMPNASTGIASRSKARATSREIEVCAQCHSRRAQIAEGYHAGARFLDYYLPSLLVDDLYEADGQQRGEVYNWGSFLQSRMHARGVTCSDCHDPHSGRLRAEGNAVCTQCHESTKFDDPRHHFHKAGTPGAQCASCHMPTRTYMEVDPRHDHSFRVPRPDLAARLGTPDACSRCHAKQGPKWAANELDKRHVRLREEPSAEAIAAARRTSAGAAKRLAAIASDASVPAITRATAVSMLPPLAGPREFSAVAPAAAADASDLVRLASLGFAPIAPPRERVSMFAPLLDDRSRVVRIEAASALAGVPREALPPAARSSFDRAVDEYRRAQRYQSDRPEAWTNLAHLEARLGDAREAGSAVAAALRLDPAYTPARLLSAEILRARGDIAGAEAELREAVRRTPRDATAHYALGLDHVRQKRLGPAIAEFERAVALAPGNARFAYVLGVALRDSGEKKRAVTVLEAARARNPGDRDIVEALAHYAAEDGNVARAQALRRELEAPARP